MTARTLDLDSLVLNAGSHSSLTEGACLLEAASYLAGERWSANPLCVSPVLGAYGRRINDRLPDDLRQQLKTFLPAMLDTAGDGLDPARAELARQILMGTWLPAWLRLADLPDLAAQAEAAVDLTGQDLMGVLVKIRDSTWLARTAARQALQSKIREELQRLRPAGAGADADAAAAAAAVAVAAAGAGAVAGAVADAAAGAGAVAVAAADAAAVADAAAGAGAVAVAAADAAAAAADRPDPVYSVVYRAMRKHYETSDSLARVRALRDQQQLEALDLFGRMVRVTA